MRLRRKLVLIFSTSYFLVFMGFFVAINAFLMQGFLDIEDTEVRQQTELGLHALDLRIGELDRTAHSFAARDDTYYYMQSRLRHFINELLLSSTFTNSEISFMAFLDEEGEIVCSKAFDLMEMRNTQFPDQVAELIRQNPVLRKHLSADSGVSGLVATVEGPLMLSSRPILTSDEKGPVMGTFVCGRYLDAIEIEKLKESTYLTLEIRGVEDLRGVDIADILSKTSAEDKVAIDRSSGERISGYSVLEDVFGEPILVMKVDSPRNVYQQGLLMVSYFLGSSIFTGLVIAMVSIIVMNRFILSRIMKLSEEVSEIDPHSIGESEVRIPGDDEISTLSANIDEMLQALKEYQVRLQERERMAVIGETSAMVGHDLRNPLQVIFLLSSRLRKRIGVLRDRGEKGADIEELEYIGEKLKEQTIYMDKIVSDLQDFSKKIRLNPSDTDLVKVVDSVVEAVKIPDDVETVIDFDDRLRSVQADENLLRRVFTNLVSNAVQAMPTGGILTVRGSVQEEEATFTVSDTGVGIDEENLGKMFQPLFTTKAKGTGLGLAVCKRIIEAHGGEIKAESTVGEGTSFSFRLPFILESEQGIQKTAVAELDGTSQPVPPTSPTESL
ncbi:hypothetical protein JXL21_02750 [Candidatus Bathyarchaeota archaeon]|nr:hypothetical protein [Candidatus Bathyarchaeota archaeon]